MAGAEVGGLLARSLRQEARGDDTWEGEIAGGIGGSNGVEARCRWCGSWKVEGFFVRLLGSPSMVVVRGGGFSEFGCGRENQESRFNVLSGREVFEDAD